MEKLLAKLKEGNSKRQMENIVIFIVLFIIVIIVINSMYSEEKVTAVKENVEEVFGNQVSSDELEKKLQNILSCMEGVGKVDVMISYSNTITEIPMYDVRENTTTIEEQDVNGGTRKTEEKSNEQSIIFEEKSSTKIPAIKQTIMPEVIGVIVVAEGASNQVIKENIKNAVGAVVNIASHRIQVFAK